MKRIPLLIMLAGLAVTGAQAKATIDIRGTVYTVDTLFHAYVGPGTTQTSLYLESGIKHMRVFYSTIDVSNPWVRLKSVSGTDMMAGSETVSSMAKRNDAPGQRYFVGINGDFWVTAGATRRGQSMVGAPISTSMAKGIIYKAQNNDGEYQFFIGDDEVPAIGNLNFGGTVVKPDGSSAPIHGINKDAAGGAITIYNPTYFAGTNQMSVCSEVQVRWADGQSMAFGKPVKLVVSAAPSTAGDLDIPADGLVLHGEGGTRDFINTLAVGDTVTLNLDVTVNGQPVQPTEAVSGHPWIVRDGVTTPNGDPAVHPRTAIGYSKDGKHVIFLVLDGRSSLSNGITCDGLGDVMRYAGCYVALNLDGGGSSCLYTSALGVRNRPSDGRERADCNGIFAVSSAPDCDTIAQLRFLDWSLTMPKYGTYTPHFFGYNKYGTLINTDVKGVKLSCTPGVGVILNDSTLYATGEGAGSLTATYQGATVQIPVSVINSADGIAIDCDSIIADGYRPYAVELHATVLDRTMGINPAALTWRSTNENVATVGATTGVVQGVADGEALVIGTIGQVCDTLRVIVERPTAHVMPVDPNVDVDTWKFSQTGGKGGKATADGQGGFTYAYTGASGRAPKLTLSKSLRLWSLPDTLRLRLNPGEAPVKNFVIGVRSASQGVSYQTLTPTITPNQEMVIDLPTAAWVNTADISNYPLTLSSIQINMNSAKSGQQYALHFMGIETIYNAIAAKPAGKGDLNGDGQVNTTDVTALVAAILAGNTTAAHDIDGDGQVNTTDVTALVTLVLGN